MVYYYVVGYNMMYVDVGNFIGSFSFLRSPSPDEVALLAGVEGAREAVIATDYSVMSDWFFQMVFVATAGSIVSGALAERVRLWSFFCFTVVLTAFIYPTVGAWTWGGGWLNAMGFQDFAGSSIVHGTGGAAALAGALVVGPRYRKFRSDGTVLITPPSNVPVVTLGVFILWFGWFGFNGGSQLALGSAADVIAISHVLVNTNLAGAAGVIAAIAVSRPILGRVDLLAGLNGAIAGLVSITAGPDITSHYWAIVIGAVGAIICTAGIKLLEKLKVDDVVGAVPAHLFAGTWGTLATAIAAGANIGGAVDRRGVDRRFCVLSVVADVAGAGEDDGRSCVPAGRADGSGRGGAGHRRLPRVRADAGAGLGRRTGCQTLEHRTWARTAPNSRDRPAEGAFASTWAAT